MDQITESSATVNGEDQVIARQVIVKLDTRMHGV